MYIQCLEARRFWILRIWDYRWLVAAVECWELNPQSSARTASTFTTEACLQSILIFLYLLGTRFCVLSTFRCRKDNISPSQVAKYLNRKA